MFYSHIMYNENRCKPYSTGLRIFYSFIGDVAQLGEYLNGIQGVRGSNPLISTNEIKGCAVCSTPSSGHGYGTYGHNRD